MKIPGYEFPKSSFLSLEKDFSIIIEKLLKNDNLKKMLYYQDKNCLSLPNLSNEQTLGLINKNITLIPKLKVNPESAAYIYLEADTFLENKTNPEFRDNFINFGIICHYDYWVLNDFQIRPFKIAGEIDSSLNNERLTGFGKLKFVNASYDSYNEEYGLVSLTYAIIHGEEDKAE